MTTCKRNGRPRPDGAQDEEERKAGAGKIGGEEVAGFETVLFFGRSSRFRDKKTSPGRNRGPWRAQKMRSSAAGQVEISGS